MVCYLSQQNLIRIVDNEELDGTVSTCVFYSSFGVIQYNLNYKVISYYNMALLNVNEYDKTRPEQEVCQVFVTINKLERQAYYFYGYKLVREMASILELFYTK